MKTWLLLFTILISFLTAGYGQNFYPPITNYSTVDYGKQRNPENWSITQDQRGVMYVGNANGILEFDGVNWNFIPVQSGAYVFSLATDSSGTVYCGVINDLGYLKPDDKGALKFHSLLDTSNVDHQNIGVVWRTFATKDKVYFQTENSILIYEKGKLSVIHSETSFHLSMLCNNRFFVREKQKGLVEIVDGEKKFVPNSEVFADYGVFSMVPLSAERNMIITQELGLYNWNLNTGAIAPISSADSSKLVSSVIYGGQKLYSGEIALFTSNEGLIIINAKGKIVKRVNTTTGIRVNDIKNIFEDKDHNLWLALNNGVSKINYNSPISFFGEESGIIGSVQAVHKFHNHLYVGTASGLYTENLDKNAVRFFKKLKAIPYQIWDFKVFNDQLLVGSGNGLFQLDSTGRTKRISNRNVNSILVVNDRLIMIAGIEGIFFLNNRFEVVESIPMEVNRIINARLNPEPVFGEYEIWIGTFDQGIIRVNIDSGEFIYDVYTEFDGLNPQWNRIQEMNGKLVYCTIYGLMKFVDEEEVNKNLPDSLKNDPDYMRGYFQVQELGDTSYEEPISFIADDGERIWAVIDNQLAYLQKSSDSLVKYPFWGINFGRFNRFYLEEDGTLWIGAADGLIRYRENDLKQYGRSFHTLIRQIRTREGTLFAGAFPNQPKGTFLQPKSFIPELEYQQNNISFEFSAPYYEDNHQLLYSYKLEGHDSEWSKWSTETKANYTNLKEGHYTFKVRSKNIYGKIGSEAAYSFEVAPPWYRTTWAYVGYAFGFIIVLIIAIRLSMMRLKAKNIRLERLVSERTAEIADKNKTLEKQKDEILHQKTEIEDSINYAKRIQEAILPLNEEIQTNLPDSFILFKPKDIVSGDFYWYALVGNIHVIVCADCTGHGVPGAFMSMIGTDKLNQVVKERKITNPAIILSEINKGIKKALKQDEESDSTRDGMDVAICSWDPDAGLLQYAGAHRPLWMVRDGVLTETKATKVAVGGFTSDDQEYELHEIQPQKGDQFYMHSDGYADQFGGPKGKKLKVKSFKKLILEVEQKPMMEQMVVLNSSIEEWMANYEQIDDVCVIGVRV